MGLFFYLNFHTPLQSQFTVEKKSIFGTSSWIQFYCPISINNAEAGYIIVITTTDFRTP